jgi:hypothetical protein
MNLSPISFTLVFDAGRDPLLHHAEGPAGGVDLTFVLRGEFGAQRSDLLLQFGAQLGDGIMLLALRALPLPHALAGKSFVPFLELAALA